jgi:translocation and assembly module TamA
MRTRTLIPPLLTSLSATLLSLAAGPVLSLAAGPVLSLAAGPAHADIKIEIPDVTPQVEGNVRAFLSLTRYADRKDVTPEVISRLQRRIVVETRKALEPLGYYEPEVTYEVAPDGENWKVTIHITPGRPVRLSDVSIQIDGPGRDARAIRAVIAEDDLKPGLRLNHGTYEKVKATLLRVAKNEGYLDAKSTKSELLIDRTERRATIAIAIDTGPRYQYGEITIAQDVINDDAMRRLLRMKQGDPYTLDSLLRTQYVLDDSQYFSAVDIESGAVDREKLTVPMTIRASPNRKHRYAVSLGYGTDTDVRGKFTWDNRRVNRLGHRSKVELVYSAVVREATARYVIPVMDIALEKIEFTGTAKKEELGDLLSEKTEIGTGLTQVTGTWQRVVFVRFSREKTTQPNPDDPTVTTQDSQFLIIPGISFSTLPSYIIGGQQRPYNLYGELRGSPSTFGSDASFLQLRLQGERTFNLSERWHLRTRAELGVSWVDDEISALPASQRFFAGGDRSVRGFDLNELSPRDSEGNRIGAKNLATGTLELERDLPRNFGVAVFTDFGNAFDDFAKPGLEYSVGIGGRYHIAVASFGVDVAQALTESRGPKVHLYISTQF